MKPKIALVISHLVQHFAPQYQSFATNKRIDFKCFFMTTKGYKPYKDENFGKEIVWDNLKVDSFENYFENDDPVDIPKNKPAGEILNQLIEYNPNVLIGYGYAHKFQRQIKKWALSNKIKYYYISDSELNHQENFFKRKLKTIWLKHYFKTIERFLTVGSANEFYYLKNGAPSVKLTRMNFPIDINSFDKAIEQKETITKEIKLQYSINPKDFIISTVGKLVEWKNQKYIIKALLDIDDKKYERIVCFIIGTGPDQKKLEHIASKLNYHQVIFTGFISPNDISKYYLASDLYVHTAKYEPHSLAISEAIYVGTPCLVSSFCGSYGPCDDVIDGYNGSVFNLENRNDFIKKIKFYQENFEQAKLFGKRAQSYAKNAQQLSHYSSLETALIADNIL